MAEGALEAKAGLDIITVETEFQEQKLGVPDQYQKLIELREKKEDNRSSIFQSVSEPRDENL